MVVSVTSLPAFLIPVSDGNAVIRLRSPWFVIPSPARDCWRRPVSKEIGGEVGGLHRPYPSDGGGRIPSKGSRRKRALGSARPFDRSLLAHADAIKNLVDPLGYERTGEARDYDARSCYGDQIN